MRILFAVVALLTLVAGPARAVTSEAVQIDAGPGGRQLDPVWLMKCPDAERLVGIRLHDDGRIAGVRAICARVKLDDSGAHWLGTAGLLAEPAPAPPPKMETVTRVVRGEGTVLRASSSGVTRERTSRALIIEIKRPVQEQVRADGEAAPSPVTRVELRDAPARDDLVCPADHVVVGLRTGARSEGRVSRLAAVQLICGDGLGRTLAPIGPWAREEAPRKGKAKRRRASAAPPLSVQRIECGASDANPHDGLAARAIFGTEDNGRVATIGLSCTGRIDSIRPHSRIYASMRATALETLRALEWSTRIDAPRWLDGTPVAICARGKRDATCLQASADRYCADVGGYRRATTYAVGRYVPDAVVPGGQRCERGTCRAFASITCAL
ncbi:MAG: hypothetical protein IT548_18275 [Alphaproteobacteria bacterium]|nr:hypothetical protein [Alphaproteobacteria bacterium]